MTVSPVMHEVLVETWIQVLGEPPRGDDADFFEAGGDSLRALEFAEAVESKGYGVDLGQVFIGGSLSEILESMRSLR